jgi:hypothetical protein
MLQGPWRLWRAGVYYKYLKQYYTEKQLVFNNQRFYIADGIGHEPERIFSSPKGSRALFDAV